VTDDVNAMGEARIDSGVWSPMSCNGLNALFVILLRVCCCSGSSLVSVDGPKSALQSEDDVLDDMYFGKVRFLLQLLQGMCRCLHRMNQAHRLVFSHPGYRQGRPSSVAAGRPEQPDCGIWSVVPLCRHR